MPRVTLRAILLGATGLASIGLACGQIASVPDSGCPPAPIRDFPYRSVCQGHPACEYLPPRNFGLPTEDPANTLSCGCSVNEWWCGAAFVGRTRITPICPASATEGAACTWEDGGDRPRNAECLVLGPNAQLDAGIIDGKACACDFPGPMWRCVDVDVLRNR